MIDFSQYVGIPFISNGRDIQQDKGLDCWGLIRLVHLTHFGVDIGTLQEVEFVPGSADIIKQKTPEHMEIIPASKVKPFDILLFSVAGHPLHGGLCTQPNWMLHSVSGNGGSRIEKYTGLKWGLRHRNTFRYNHAI